MKLRVGLSYIKYVGAISDKCKEIPDDATIDKIVSLKIGDKRVIASLIKAGALDHVGNRKDMLISVLKIEEDIEKCKHKIAECEQKIIELTEENDKKKDKTTKVYQKNLDMIKNRVQDMLKAQEKIKQLQNQQKLLESYDEVKGEIEVLGFSFKEVPRVKSGTLTNIFSKPDKNSREMGWLTFKTDYGEFRCTCFAKGWSLIKDKISKNGLYVFVVSDQGILEELQVEGQVIKTNERKWNSKWKR